MPFPPFLEWRGAGAGGYKIDKNNTVDVSSAEFAQRNSVDKLEARQIMSDIFYYTIYTVSSLLTYLCLETNKRDIGKQ